MAEVRKLDSNESAFVFTVGIFNQVIADLQEHLKRLEHQHGFKVKDEKRQVIVEGDLLASLPMPLSFKVIDSLKGDNYIDYIHYKKIYDDLSINLKYLNGIDFKVLDEFALKLLSYRNESYFNPII